jgi:hypothetical protein
MSYLVKEGTCVHRNIIKLKVAKCFCHVGTGAPSESPDLILGHSWFEWKFLNRQKKNDNKTSNGYLKTISS